MMPGTLIVLEGPDGSGTTKHSELLAERLMREEHDVVLTCEPTKGRIGQAIRAMLHGETLPSPDAIQLLFCADRAEHVSTVIGPALAEGKIVISDRYALSTIVYGAAFGLDTQWLAEVNSRFPQPDLTVLALPPLDVCLERLERRDTRDQFEKRELQKRIWQLYADWRTPTPFVQIDTSAEKEIVAEVLYEKVVDFLRSRKQ